MDHLSELYQEMIIDHNRSPRNYGKLDCANCKAEGYNPLCGDEITVYMDIENDVIKDIRFEGKGCAISTASASMMTQQLKGKTVSEAKTFFQAVHRILTDEDCHDAESLGKIASLAGVKAFPTRVKCATLAWHTLLAALEHSDKPACTE